MKVRLKSFINRYKEMSGEMKDASEDKENVSGPRVITKNRKSQPFDHRAFQS